MGRFETYPYSTVVFSIAFILLCVAFLPATPTTRAQDTYIRSPHLGVTFVNPGDAPNSDARYRNALDIGVGWNRYPIYWNEVEVEPGVFTWGKYDRLAANDARYGLRTNAILLGIPEFYRDGESIIGLREPIFADGTDTPAPGKAVNPNNHWAVFVDAAVSRYAPGISIWEAWNEPDFDLFWRGSVDDYARLLKVTYLVTKQVDSNAQVMFGGLAFSEPDKLDWLDRVLAIYANDLDAETNNWYMDIVAVHSYTYAPRSATLVDYVQNSLALYGLARPVWLNETGVPVWDDYPGPTWAGSPAERALRATEEQAAAYLMQSAAFALASGAEVVLHHQLYDDCGNQPFGTNFPPHNGELCTPGQLCWGDAHGLFRNEVGASCFSQHPQPGSPRPAAAAFRMIAEALGDARIDFRSLLTLDARVTVAVFDQLSAQRRVYVVWSRLLSSTTLNVPVNGTGGATLYTVSGSTPIEPNAEGDYRLSLPGATPDDYPFLALGEASGIGGMPVILVETGISEQFNPAILTGALPVAPGNAPPTLAPPTPTLPPVRLQPPTLMPDLDTRPPQPYMIALPENSPPTFIVSWGALEQSGVQQYVVWVRVNGGDWRPWLETDQTRALYTGSPDNRYEFAVWAQDLGGNWSMNVELSPMASTNVQPPLITEGG